jgi:hypothetical protein
LINSVVNAVGNRLTQESSVNGLPAMSRIPTALLALNKLDKP